VSNHVGRNSVAEALSSDTTFVTFAGTETFLLFLQEYPLREFCAFEVLDNEAAWTRLKRELIRPIADACTAHGHGLITDALVWRATPDFVEKLGYSQADLARINQQAVAIIASFIDEWRAESGVSASAAPAILSAELGPRGDGYKTSDISVDAAFDYHSKQIEVLAGTDLDLAIALTMTNVNETVGMVNAARKHGLPIGVSPTVETDGTLPGGMKLSEFVKQVDDATDGFAAFHMVNCAHPEHLVPTLAAAKAAGEGWVDRIRGLRANASNMSHEELDNSTEIDRGDVQDLATQMGSMRSEFSMNIVGGCCGTDAEHINAIAKACS